MVGTPQERNEARSNREGGEDEADSTDEADSNTFNTQVFFINQTYSTSTRTEPDSHHKNKATGTDDQQADNEKDNNIE
eukprot:scaffold127154_cov45-Attheya_sp.AAC.2